MNQRNVNLDLLRIAGAFAVVWLHVSAEVVSTNPSMHSGSWWVGNVADALSRWAVPIFVMASGALLLHTTSDQAPREFYSRRAARLLVPIIFWTLLYVLLGAYRSHQFSLMDTAIAILTSRLEVGVHLWYLYMLIGLYLATPFLRQIVAASTRSELRLLVGLSFAISGVDSVLGVWYGGGVTSFLSRFVPYVGYFVAGHYLVTGTYRPRRGILLAVAIACAVAIALGTGALLPALGPKSWELMYSNPNPFVIVMSVCVFLLLANCSLGSGKLLALVQIMAPLTLGVYVAHPSWQWVLGKLGIDGVLVHPLVGIPVASLAVFMLSAATAGLLGAIPLLRRTVR
jgi:surface polysaccharide O-acyltransferase-like enzyme